MSQILIDEVSPNGNITAYAEDDGKCVYFYLHGAPEIDFGVRSCWVRNLGPAPTNLDIESMRGGEPPLLPARFCRHLKGAAPLDSDRLRIVWFEEGDAAALLEDGEILAVIPGWSGLNGFSGYARDCTAENPLCWPLGSPDSNAMFARVAESEAFWASWKSSDPWPVIQQGVLDALELSIGPYTNYYSADGGAWPPKAIVRTAANSAAVAVTCGMSIRPQPRVERTGDDAASRRIELGIAVSGTPEGDVLRAIRYLSAQSNLPWYFYSPLGAGHTIPCDSIPTGASGTEFVAVLLSPNPAGAPNVSLPGYRGDAVSLLWMLPITEAERDVAVRNGSLELEQKLRASGVGWVHHDRKSVA